MLEPECKLIRLGAFLEIVITDLTNNYIKEAMMSDRGR